MERKMDLILVKPIFWLAANDNKLNSECHLGMSDIRGVHSKHMVHIMNGKNVKKLNFHV